MKQTKISTSPRTEMPDFKTRRQRWQPVNRVIPRPCGERCGEQPRASEREPRPARLQSSTSAPRPPVSRVPWTMDYAKYDDLVGQGEEVDRVREASYERAACLTLDAWVRQR